MLISVITVTLNPGELLERTVSSILEQSCHDWEMVIQDGGSTDGSLDQLPDDPRIKVVTGPDDGIYDAMNRALSGTRGDYVIFLNAGDTLSDGDVITDLLLRIEELDRPELMFCDYENVAGRRTMRLPERLSSVGLFRSVYCHQAVFFSRGLFEELGEYDTSLSIRADLDFLYRCHARRPRVRSGHLGRRGVLYDGAGYSSRSDLRALKEEELKRIRTRHLPTWKRITFSILHELTLVRLRNWRFRRSLQTSQTLNR